MAMGDDHAGTDDEFLDFIAFALRTGKTVTFTFQNWEPSDGELLDAWIDFNADGNWNGVNERIARSLPLTSLPTVSDDYQLRVPIPYDAATTDTFARFRVSTTGVDGTGGFAVDGEVEDHQFTVHPYTEFYRSAEYFGPRALRPARYDELLSVDLDGDGDQDLIGKDRLVDRVVWNELVEAEQYQAHTVISGGSYSNLHVMDWDGDQRPDVVAYSQRIIGHVNDSR